MSIRKVKGTHLIQAREQIDGRFGAGMFDHLSERENSATGTLLPGAWYAVEPLVRVLRNAAREMGLDLETLSAQIARANALDDLPSIYRVFLRVAQPQHLLNFVPQLWRTYVDFGEAHTLHNDVGRYLGQCDELAAELTPWACGFWLGFLPAAVGLCSQRTTSAKIVRTWRQNDGLHSLQVELQYLKSTPPGA